MKKSFILGFVMSFIILTFSPLFAEEVDQDLLNALKIEANHNLNRLKSLHEEKRNNKIYEDEREKGLGSYLEEQEKWDALREKGLAEYRKQKKKESPADDGLEFKEDFKEKQKEKKQAEKNREIQVRTRNQVLSQNPGVVNQLENEELGLLERRPRYDLRKRAENKWIKAKSEQSSAVGGAHSYTPSPTNTNSGFPPPPPMEYTPAPPAVDSYDDIPPPPPPSGYDYGNGASVPYDAGYGNYPPPPPPPPPPGDYDF